MDLEAVPGVGEKTAAALAELDDPEAALEAGDVATLARAPGITEGRAVNLARAAIRARHDEAGAFLATDRAREVYDDLLSLLQDRAVTDHAAKRLATLFPTGAESRIAEVRDLAERAVERDPDPDVQEALAGVEPLAEPGDLRVRERCVATSDAETYAQAREALPELSVELVEDARGLADLARGYSTVVVLDEEFAGVEVEGDVRVEPDALADPAAVVPERPLALFAANRESIHAAAAVHRRAGLEAPLDLDALDAALDRLDEEGGVVGDDELDRLDAALDDLDAAVSTAESVANDRLRDAIRERDVTIEGADLLSLVEQGAGVDSLLDRELADVHAAAVAAAREHLADALALTDDERSHAEAAFDDEPTYPVAADDDAVGRLREDLTAARDRRAARRKRELAAALTDLREPARELVAAALDYDVELAISRFASDFGCTFAERSGRGFAVEGGRSPLLAEEFADVEPVDYQIEDVALLSGVNSGGKTATLDLVAAVTVLAHAGLPVPAESARVPAVDRLAYHAKSQGTLDAGAFETTLRQFAELVADPGPTLVLVDELESITEPGASATIIAGVLEELLDSPATALFVSHLAGDVRAAADVDLAVDGIRALGLEDGQLRVDRSPVKDHLARSTPELIVEKLADASAADGEPTAAFYEHLLAKFEAGE